MSKDRSPVEKAQRELELVIKNKLDRIRENILIGTGPSGPMTKLSMLSEISDGLSDVLLEFETNALDSQYGDETF